MKEFLRWLRNPWAERNGVWDEHSRVRMEVSPEKEQERKQYLQEINSLNRMWGKRDVADSMARQKVIMEESFPPGTVFKVPPAELSPQVKAWIAHEQYKAGIPGNAPMYLFSYGKNYVQEEIADRKVMEERERCAAVAEAWPSWSGRSGYDGEEYAAEDIAAKIRSGE